MFNFTKGSRMGYMGLSGMDERTSSEDYPSHTARPGKRSNDTAKRAKRRSHHSQSPSHYVLPANQRDTSQRDAPSIYHVSWLFWEFACFRFYLILNDKKQGENAKVTGKWQTTNFTQFFILVLVVFKTKKKIQIQNNKRKVTKKEKSKICTFPLVSHF